MRRFKIFLVLLALTPGLAAAQGLRAVPADLLVGVERLDLPEVDLFDARLADEERAENDQVVHFAVPIEVDITPLPNEDGFVEHGRWDRLTNDLYRWRLRLHSFGALSLNLAFSRFHLPAGSRLTIWAVDGSDRIGPFTQRDNEAHGQLWTPPILADDIVLEVVVPVDFEDFELRLSRVHHGYAGFGERVPSGACQADAACTDAESWQAAARSVGLISIDGVRFCSGFLVNNTAEDGRPFFVTAYHCGVTAENAASVVVMWNFESPTCRADGDLEAKRLANLLRPGRHAQTGAVLRAAWQATDIALLELDDRPRAAWNVHFAGWDRSDAIPAGATVFHHPNTDLKRASVDHDTARPTAYLADQADPEGDHLRIDAWDLGSTEGGSSGAPLFNEAGRVVGQLHGGWAACGEPQAADWFGRFAVSWTGGGQAAERLSDWLDPLSSGAVVLDGRDAAELR